MTGHRGLASLIRTVAAPVACAILLTGLLSVWVATGAGGTVRRMSLQFELAALPSLPSAHNPATPATTYLVIKNRGGPDELLSAQAPASPQIILARNGREPRGAGAIQASLAIPAGATTSFSPFGPDIVLLRPHVLKIGETVPLTLTFRHAGKVTVQFTVTPPGTP
jgi:copper(I)-binding protein